MDPSALLIAFIPYLRDTVTKNMVRCQKQSRGPEIAAKPVRLVSDVLSGPLVPKPNQTLTLTLFLTQILTLTIFDGIWETKYGAERSPGGGPL